MLAYLQGKFVNKSPAQVVVDVQGVGYEVNISLNTYSSISDLQEGRLHTFLQIKEDAHTIYGFFEKEEKDIFILLISVSGVGASTARMMLSSLKPDEIAKAIMSGDVRLLESIKGIAKKSAQRLVLELKDKISKQPQGVGIEMPVSAGNNLNLDALNALTALGIHRGQAEQALKKVIQQEPGIHKLEILIKKALQAI
jgi:Holliday junction DNA helicase RuvA